MPWPGHTYRDFTLGSLEPEVHGRSEGLCLRGQGEAVINCFRAGLQTAPDKPGRLCTGGGEGRKRGRATGQW